MSEKLSIFSVVLVRRGSIWIVDAVRLHFVCQMPCPPAAPVKQCDPTGKGP